MLPHAAIVVNDASVCKTLRCQRAPRLPLGTQILGKVGCSYGVVDACILTHQAPLGV